VIDDAGLDCSLGFRIRNNNEVGRESDARGAVRVLLPEGVDDPEESGCSVGTCDRGVEGELSDVCDRDGPGSNAGRANGL